MISAAAGSATLWARSSLPLSGRTGAECPLSGRFLMRSNDRAPGLVQEFDRRRRTGGRSREVERVFQRLVQLANLLRRQCPDEAGELALEHQRQKVIADGAAV